MAMKKTSYYISEENLSALEILKERYSLSTNGQVINFLIQQAMENQEERIAKAVIQEMNDSYLSKERLKWSLQTAEQHLNR